MPPVSAGRLPHWTIILGLLTVAVVLGVALNFMLDEREDRRWRTEQVVIGEPYTKPTGRAVITEFSDVLPDGLLPGVVDLRVSGRPGMFSVQLIGEARSRAACPGPDWVRSPGALLIEPADRKPGAQTMAPGQGVRTHAGVRVSWFWCAGEVSSERELASRRLAELLVRRLDPDELWSWPRDARDPAFVHMPSGLLNPAVEATGIDHEGLTCAALLGGVLLCTLIAGALGPMLDRATSEPGDGARPSRWVPAYVVPIALVLVTLLRLWWGLEADYDPDESWARRLPGSIFHESHDVWVHPPVFHLIQQPWVRAIGWAPGDSLLLLRLPMLVCGIVALALILPSLRTRAPTPAYWLLALPCLFAPQLGVDMVLARPYPLATLLVVCCVIGLWPLPRDDSRERPWLARAHWALALTAAGLAAWTDVIAGFAATALITLRLLSLGRGAWVAKLAILLVALAWLAPLVPGMLVALEYQIDPNLDQALIDQLGILRPAEVRPEPDLTRELPAYMMFGLLRHSWLWRVSVVALAGLLCVHGWRAGRRRVEAALPLMMLVAALLVASSLVHLRSRNVAFAPHLMLVFAAIALAPKRPPRSAP